MAEEERSHVCVLCNCALESKESLQVHFRKHANKEIDNRGKPLKTKSPKKVNKKETSGNETGNVRIIECDVCGQEFSQSARAIQHKFKKHPNVFAKYICPYCGMQFTMKTIYDNHLHEHISDERKKSSFLCDECGTEFYFEEAKNYHYKSTHMGIKTLLQPPPTPPPSKKIKLSNAGDLLSAYYCHLCGCEYVLKFNLQRHIKKIHTELERTTVPTDLIRCKTCDALFYNTKAYEAHNNCHKPGDLYVTSEQQRLQIISKVDQDFDIRRVLPLAEKYLPSYKVNSKKKDGFDYMVTEIKKEKLSSSSSPESPSNNNDSDKDVLLIDPKKKLSEILP